MFRFKPRESSGSRACLLAERSVRLILNKEAKMSIKIPERVTSNPELTSALPTKEELVTQETLCVHGEHRFHMSFLSLSFSSSFCPSRWTLS